MPPLGLRSATALLDRYDQSGVTDDDGFGRLISSYDRFTLLARSVKRFTAVCCPDC